MAVHGDDFACLSDDDRFLKSKYKAKHMGTFGFGDSDVKSLLLLNRVFGVGTDQTSSDTHRLSSVNRDAMRTQKTVRTPRKRNCKTNWCQTEDGVRF